MTTRTTILIAATALAVAGCASLSNAAELETLSPEALAPMMIGATHHVDVGQSEAAVIYYETAAKAHMRFPDGKTLKGDWRFTEAGYFVDWRDGPKGEWQIGFTPGRLVYLDAKGDERGDIVRIVPGDAQGFTH